VHAAPAQPVAAATAARVLAAVSRFYEWAIVAELLDAENPMRRQPDPALASAAERHRPFTGGSKVRPLIRGLYLFAVEGVAVGGAFDRDTATGRMPLRTASPA
jgi:hypothetical protein